MKSVVDLRGWVLVVLAMVISRFCHAGITMKRAVPVYILSKHVQGNNSVEKDKDEFFVKFWKQQNGGSCPFGQMLQRNNNVCCVVTVCGPGEEIEACRVNGTEDKSSKCKPGFIQKNNISSLDMKEANCFLQVRDHEDCPMGDMKPARNNLSDNFPLPCECKFEECYIEDEVGSCNKMAKCKAGFQMNRKNGTCDACPWYAYKSISGCQPCTKNVTLLRQGKPGGLFIPPNMRTTIAANVNTKYIPENDSVAMRENSQIKTQTSSLWNIILIVVLAVIATTLIVLILAYIHYCYRKRMSRTSDYVRPTPHTEPLLQGQINIAPAGGEYGNGVWNGGMNGGPKAGAENGGVIHANQWMLDGNNRRNMAHNGGATDQDNTTLEIDNPVSVPAKARTRMDQLQRTENLDLSNRDTNGGTFEASSSDHGAIGGVAENVTCSGDRLMGNSEGHIAQGETNDITNAVSRTIAVDLLECEANQSCANAKQTSEVEDKKSDEKKTNNAKPTRPNTVSIHDNQFHDCNIFIGENTRRKVCTGNTNKKEIHLDNLKNISGSFEMSESNSDYVTNSGYSSGIGSSPTLKQPDRRAVNADRENDATGKGKVSNEPPCRPELTNGACGAGMDNTAAPRREVKFNSKYLKIEMECSGSVTDQELNGRDDDRKVTGETRQTENADIRDSSETRGADPFQRSISRERPIRRVEPLRQNSECVEVRHVSGYPSERRNDETSEPLGSFNSMSYAFMHCDSELSNGFMTEDIANNHDIDDDGDENMRLDMENMHLNHAQRNSPIGRELVREGSEQMCSGLDGGCTYLNATVNLDMQWNHQSAMPPFRRDVNRAYVTHAVPPISIREAPDGNSISSSENENDHFISRSDMQQTDRKVVAEEDSTREKEVNSEKTKGKIVDDDDDLTRYKKAREIKECDNPICLKSGNKDSEEMEDIEASFEINSEEMQNMKNAQEIVDEGKNLAEEEKAKNIETEHNEEDEDVDCEISFEVDSRDIENIREHKTNRDDIESAMETSFDVDMNDIEALKRVSSCSSLGSVKESKASFEIDSNDIDLLNDGIKSVAEASFEVDSEDIELLKNDVSTTVMEETRGNENTSFELNPDQIENLAINQSDDNREHEHVDTRNAEEVKSEVEIDSNEKS